MFCSTALQSSPSQMTIKPRCRGPVCCPLTPHKNQQIICLNALKIWQIGSILNICRSEEKPFCIAGSVSLESWSTEVDNDVQFLQTLCPYSQFRRGNQVNVLWADALATCRVSVKLCTYHGMVYSYQSHLHHAKFIVCASRFSWHISPVHKNFDSGNVASKSCLSN